ncbi:S8 family serine peptidase [Geodermatophilus sp. DSM 44513]|uniref:S8 family serine peptidase n=1 Tax=Geodermatophilus sp. DSM 44513 TaxID=1528104 RepID=UPI00126AAADA|nr:S8 family serine peptidase [Geodermatophilus sp. DSM 44513]WNV76024.1 S8 family serine peptidase [Geodermatophilus sp. DSM 44513]
MTRSSLPRRHAVRTLAVLTGSLVLALGGVTPAAAETEEAETATVAEEPEAEEEADEEESEESEEEDEDAGDGGAGGGTPDDGITADPSEDPVDGVDQIVVAVQPGTDVAALAAEYGLTVVDQLAGSPDTHLLQAPPGTDVTALAAELAADPRTRFAEPNFNLGAPEANPTYRWRGGDGSPVPAGSDPAAWTGQQALTQVGAAAAQAASTGAGVTVAVLDTGVAAGHPSLAGDVAASGPDLVDGDTTPDDVGNGVDDDGDGRVDEATGHGTHVAGIVLAVAPDAQVLPVRVLDSDGIGTAFGLAEGVRAALDAGADVLNMSLGTAAESQLLAEVLEEADEDAVVVASAGNSGTQALQYPAATGGVVSVASVGPQDALSEFSNRGWVDVAAPGEDVVSTFPGGGFATWAGTSMATPFVAGQAALLVPLLGEDPAGAVPGLITSTAVAGDPLLGAGRVDLAASTAAAGSATGSD